jgi:hypothetical protein
MNPKDPSYSDQTTSYPQFNQPSPSPHFPNYPPQYPQSGQNFPQYPGQYPQQPMQQLPPQGPARELIRTRCTQGKLVVTDHLVRIELFQLKQESMARASIVGVDYKLVVPSLFGLGGGADLVFHGQGGERLHANLVKPKIAKQIMRMLGY